jgi:hypothetical protein
VRVWLPTVSSVAKRLPVPFMSVESAGNAASVSVLVKCRVPEYVLTVVFEASSAVTVKLKAVPALTLAGAVTEKCVAAGVGGGGLGVPPDSPPQEVNSTAVSTAGNHWKARKRCISPPFAPK